MRVLLLILLLAIPAFALEDPTEACLEVVRRYVTDIYEGRLVEALDQVRGVDPAKAPLFTEFVEENISSQAYRALSDCGDNLFAMAWAVETRGDVPPARLEDLAGPGTPFFQGLPRCPALGVYHYERGKGGDYRLWCGTDAHARIGIAGNYPEFSRRGGLSLGNQRLQLAVTPAFGVEDWRLEPVDWDEDLGFFRVRHVERSRLGPLRPWVERTSTYVLSQDDGGAWRIDLTLSNRDMVFVFDPERWQEQATIPRQVLFYYQLSNAVGFETPDVDDRAHLEVRVCESNLRSISLGVEEWSVRHAGDYPRGLDAVVPSVMREMPVCPAGGQYRYRLEPPGSYRIWCGGHVHAAAGVAADHPALTPVLGIE